MLDFVVVGFRSGMDALMCLIGVRLNQSTFHTDFSLYFLWSTSSLNQISTKQSGFFSVHYALKFIFMFSVSKVVLLLWYLNTLVWYQTLEFKFCRLEHPASPELWCRISNFFQQSFASNMFTCYNNRPHNKTLSRRNAKKFRHVIYSLCADPNVIILKTRFHRTVWFSSVRDSYGPLTRSTSTARVVSLPSQTAACCMLWVHDGWCHGSKVLGVEWTSGSSLSGSWSSSIAAPPG